MDLLDCAIQPYDWGSTTAIADLQGRTPTGEPEAELWIGAHPKAPSQLTRNGRTVGLDEVIAADPVAELGAACAERFDGRLPYLLKILAAAEPLSLQAHPTLERARRGFADEEAAGVPFDAPHRLFRDPNHKPELICALTPFAALCGFRAPDRSLELLEAADAGPLGAAVADRLRRSPDADGLREAMVTVLSTDRVDAAPSLARLGEAAASGIAGFATESEWLVRLVDKCPDDPAVFVAALLDLVVLAPGEALFLSAGNLHSYLGGVGVEVMANSDNVLRGGMTTKHVDVDALAEVVVTEPGAAPVQRPGGPVWTYASPVDEFSLTRIVAPAESVALPDGPVAVLCVDGDVTVHEGSTSTAVVAGRAGWLPACAAGPRSVEGSGTVFVATTGPGRGLS